MSIKIDINRLRINIKGNYQNKPRISEIQVPSKTMSHNSKKT